MAIWAAGGGEAGGLLRAFDWAATPLGPAAQWPVGRTLAIQLALHSQVPMLTLWGREGIMIYNDAYAAFAGGRHPGLFGKPLLEGWPEAAEFHANVLSTCLGGGTLTYRDLTLTLQRQGVPEEVSLNLDFSPIPDLQGTVDGVLGIVAETTAQLRREALRQEVEETRRQRTAQLARIYRISGVGGLEVDLRGGFVNMRSPEYLSIHGLPPSAADESHEAWVARIHPEDRAATERHFLDTVAGDGKDYQAEYRIIRPSDGEIRWISALAEIERDAEGKAVRLIGVHSDITARKQSEAQLRLLMQELTHRVKNSMAMVQAIASQTLRSAPSLDDARATLTARLLALGEAHDALVRGNWSEATLSAVLDGVVKIQGEPHRFEKAGPEVRLGAKAGLALALILHELGTNAVKYGALSRPEGRVAINWRLDEIDGEMQFRLRWQERGGPPVEPPARRGFGTRLIERSFPSTQARIETAYLRDGVVFTLDAPLSVLRGDEEARS